MSPAPHSRHPYIREKDGLLDLELLLGEVVGFRGRARVLFVGAHHGGVTNLRVDHKDCAVRCSPDTSESGSALALLNLNSASNLDHRVGAIATIHGLECA
jgi:hypothetical protein